MESTSQYDSLRSFPGQSISSQHGKRRTRDSIPTYKVLMIGNVDVGKTCLLMRLCEDRFPREKKEYTLGKCENTSAKSSAYDRTLIMYIEYLYSQIFIQNEKFTIA